MSKAVPASQLQGKKQGNKKQVGQILVRRLPVLWTGHENGRELFPCSREKRREKRNYVGEKSNAEGIWTRTIFPGAGETGREVEKIAESGRLVPRRNEARISQGNSFGNPAAATPGMEHTMLAGCTPQG
ncbi:MAG TPA: hypothetical protein VHY79_03705, partial [Rhizomicrobium sp.]|nr:hypothetical protein [Rhizomicrobium sp.]